ncbi:MAG: sulfite exporter TauE/SafE family protein [Verrucomicrobiales bacterium]
MPILIALAIGAVAGAIAALCGVGGGILMVPAFRYFLQFDQKTAVATSLAAIIATSVAASIPNTANDLVNWKIALAAGAGGALVAWLASGWLVKLSNRSLEIGFAVLLLVFGANMLWKALRG